MIVLPMSNFIKNLKYYRGTYLNYDAMKCVEACEEGNEYFSNFKFLG